MSEGQGSIQERYNPTGQDPTKTLNSWNNQNQAKGLDPSGRGAEWRAFNYDMLKMFYQNNFSEYMWNKENFYNSTSQQLKRWKDAGGNPNAFFGGGTNTGNASSLTSASPGNGTPAYGLGMAAMEATANLTKNFWEQRKTKAEAERQEIENGTLRQINEANLDYIRKNAYKIEKDANLTEAQTKQILELLPYLKGKTSAEIDELKQRKENLIEEGENIKQMRKKLKAETWEAVCSAYIKSWEAWYRKVWGTNPDGNWVNQIIQFLTGGIGKLTPGNVFDEVVKFLKDQWEDFDNLTTMPTIEGDNETYYYDPETNSYKSRPKK